MFHLKLEHIEKARITVVTMNYVYQSCSVSIASNPFDNNNNQNNILKTFFSFNEFVLTIKHTHHYINDDNDRIKAECDCGLVKSHFH